ncbi:hypothetical protein BC835DRAFT_580339 [Cytidiella melzeri]|nr:hypothetical protein BC835DRAFT_580339 [Cytidiella melzeri]
MYVAIDWQFKAILCIRRTFCGATDGAQRSSYKLGMVWLDVELKPLVPPTCPQTSPLAIEFWLLIVSFVNLAQRLLWALARWRAPSWSTAGKSQRRLLWEFFLQWHALPLCSLVQGTCTASVHVIRPARVAQCQVNDTSRNVDAAMLTRSQVSQYWHALPLVILELVVQEVQLRTTGLMLYLLITSSCRPTQRHSLWQGFRRHTFLVTAYSCPTTLVHPSIAFAQHHHHHHQ